MAAAPVGNYLTDDVLGEVWHWDTAMGAVLYRQPLDMRPAFCVHRFDTDERLFVHWDDNDEQTSDALHSPEGTWVA